MAGLSLIVGKAQGSVQCDTMVSLGILRCSHPQALMRKLCIRYLGIYDYQSLYQRKDCELISSIVFWSC